MRKVLQDPIIKLLAIHHPIQLLHMQVENSKKKNKDLIPTDSNVDIFINEFLHLVINNFKK